MILCKLILVQIIRSNSQILAVETDNEGSGQTTLAREEINPAETVHR